MKVRLDVETLRRNAKLVSQFSSGRGIFDSKGAYSLFEVIPDGVRLTLTSQLGEISIEMDAEVEEQGKIGIDLTAFTNFLKGFRSGWEVELTTDLCERTDERAILSAVFKDKKSGACSRQEWVIHNGCIGGLLFGAADLPDIPKQTGELIQGTITLSRLKEIVSPALAGYREDLRNADSMVNGAALTLSSDQIELHATSGNGGVQVSAWADEGVELGLQWEHATRTIWVNGESLKRATNALASVHGLKTVLITVPTQPGQPIKLAAAQDPEGFWVHLQSANEGIPLPELISSAARSTDKAVATLPTHQGLAAQWSLLKALETLKAYQSHDISSGQRDLSPTILEITPDGLLLEVVSDLMVGGSVGWPWTEAPKGRLMEGKRLPIIGLNMRLLLDYLCAVLEPISRDKQADIELVLSIDENGQERVLLRSESESGIKATAMVCTLSLSGRRVADVLNEQAETKELVAA